MSRSLIIGAAFVDIVLELPKLPSSGQDVTANFRKYNIGGSAFNVYGALQYAEQPADLFVPVGNGQYADMVRAQMQRAKISEKLSISTGDNGWDLSFVEPNGERTFVTIQGVEQQWRPEWFDNINVKDYQYFYLSGYEMEDPKTANVILDGLANRRSDSYLLFDVSPRVSYLSPKIMARLLTQHVIVHANQDEVGELLGNGSNLAGQITQVNQRTDAPVLVTLGEAGTLYCHDGKQEKITAEKNRVVNTIGAGDTYCGGIIAGLSQGMSMIDAIKFGTHLASLVVGQETSSLVNH